MVFGMPFGVPFGVLFGLPSFAVSAVPVQ